MCFRTWVQRIVVASLCLVQIGYADFGYISYSTTNIGDDIQSVAAKRFLPKDSIPIDRAYVGEFSHDRPVKTIMNGFFMHTKKFAWYRTDVPPPEKSWPPSPSIDPLFVSIHFTKGFLPEALSDEAVQYLQDHGPVGARDLTTLKALQDKGVPAYFSGCLTLTLENPCHEREDVIYAVDLDDDCLSYLQSVVRSQIRVVHHGMLSLPLLNNDQRLLRAERILKMYGRAKCVVTGRLHATMPCLGLKTPVFLIVEKDNPRFLGLKELTHWCTKEDFLKGAYDFSFDAPPNNPPDYLPLREKLIATVRQWVANHAAGTA